MILTGMFLAMCEMDGLHELNRGDIVLIFIGAITTHLDSDCC